MKKYLQVDNYTYYLYFLGTLLYLETVLRCFLRIPGFPVYTLLFMLPAAGFLGFGCHLLSGLAGRIGAYALTVLLILAYGAQIVYHYIYGSFASVILIGMSGDAVGTFGGAALPSFLDCLPVILLLFVPLGVLILLTIRQHPKRKHFKGLRYFPVLIVPVLLHFGVVLLLPLGGKQAYSPWDLYHETFVLDKSEQTFGVLVTLRMELASMVSPRREVSLSGSELVEVILPTPEPEKGGQGTQGGDRDDTLPDPTPTPTPYPDQVYAIDFGALAENAPDGEYKLLAEYFNSCKPTKQNNFTGMFEGYNLIIMCCESYTPYMLDEELTPTLYQMSREGIVFHNFYNTICDNTSNSEYVLNMSLLPDVSLYSDGSDGAFNTFTYSKNNCLPFAFGNRLKKEGYRSFAFHNFSGSYYKRDETHENMGYEFMYMKKGLKYEKNFPTSDGNMVRQSLDYLLQTDDGGQITPFVAYYLTFSGHMPYRFSHAEHWFTGNDMAMKNREAVAHLPYSEKTKAFLACQLELEYAMKELLASLEKAGIADRTLVVVTGDHYPYSLGMSGVEELAGHALDQEFDKYKGSFILWTKGMEETIQVDTPCCSLDILPTLYNLLGVDYDSRLVMGTDVFSEGPHAAILMDRSFITDVVTYNANTGETRVKEGVTLPEGYVDAWNSVIKDKYQVSKLVLYKDFYRYLGLE